MGYSENQMLKATGFKKLLAEMIEKLFYTDYDALPYN
jgi:hypothetical protein